MSILQIITYVIAALILFVAIYLSVSTNLLRNPISDSTKKGTFSFSRVQLLWWTLIVSCSYIILYGIKHGGQFNFFNSSTLALLSIGVVTTAGASVIDVSQKQSGMVRHQDKGSQGFFVDILSDDSGISMHRLQTVIFNVVFGIVFIVYLIEKQAFPDFSNAELALVGVSSGAYLALKTNENKNISTDTKNTSSSEDTDQQ